MTVEDLIRVLGHMPLKAELRVSGADIGGYDVTWYNGADVWPQNGDTIVYITGAGDEITE
jgi:hypothetical protein